MTTMLRIRYFFTRLRTLLWVCPECGNRLGSTKQCQSCDEQQAALQGMASDDLRLLRSILRSLASLWSSIVIYVRRRIVIPTLELLRVTSAIRCCIGFFMGNSLSDPKTC